MSPFWFSRAVPEARSSSSASFNKAASAPFAVSTAFTVSSSAFLPLSISNAMPDRRFSRASFSSLNALIFFWFSARLFSSERIFSSAFSTSFCTESAVNCKLASSFLVCSSFSYISSAALSSSARFRAASSASSSASARLADSADRRSLIFAESYSSSWAFMAFKRSEQASMCSLCRAISFSLRYRPFCALERSFCRLSIYSVLSAIAASFSAICSFSFLAAASVSAMVLSSAAMSDERLITPVLKAAEPPVYEPPALTT